MCFHFLMWDHQININKKLQKLKSQAERKKSRYTSNLKTLLAGRDIYFKNKIAII